MGFATVVVAVLVFVGLAVVGFVYVAPETALHLTDAEFTGRDHAQGRPLADAGAATAECGRVRAISSIPLGYPASSIVHH